MADKYAPNHPLARWMFRLGSPNQWRNVPYVHDEGRFVRCELCGTGGMSKKICRTHFHGLGHSQNYQFVKRLEETIKKGACVEAHSGYLPVIEKLGLEAWRNTLKAKMFEIVAEKDTVQAGLESMKLTAMISKYKRMEKASLLELALWKAKIVDGVFFSTMDDARSYGALDFDFDAKQFFSHARIECGCEFIVPLVLSYLG